MCRVRNSNLLGKIAVFIVICFCGLSAQAKYGGGSGNSNDPYLIYTAEQMNAIGADSDDWDKCFKLMADIDLSGYTGPEPPPPPPPPSLYQASNPNPTDGASGVSTTADLSWTAGLDAISHDVYFGTTSSPPFICNQTTTTFDPGTMAAGSKYYWRIDEVNDSVKTTGDIWRFTTMMSPPPPPPLTADVDLSGYTGTSFNIIGYYDFFDKKPFTGVFDGNGHTISNFTYTSTGTDYTGIFAYVSGENAEIKNLGLINPNVDAGIGCSVGPLVGYFKEGTVSDCYAEGASVSGKHHISGLVGQNAGNISNCYSTGSISGTGRDVGGLVGANLGTINNCYSSSNVSGDERVGGLVGIQGEFSAEAIIKNCYAVGDVSGNEGVGGLVGQNEEGTISSCYATGSVSGLDYVGGLVGSGSTYVFSSYWDIQTSGQTISGGGTPKTTEQMQELNTFLYWGACGNDGVWTIDEGNDYPRLAWQNLPGVTIVTDEPVYGGGSGTEPDPFQIWTAEQLNTIGLIPCHWDKHFLLCADIDLSAYTGTSFNIIGYYVSNYDNKPFTGVFDGNGHTISNFTYTSTGTDYTGIFAYVSGENAEIKNLGLIDPNVDAGTGWSAGPLVGGLQNGTVTACYAEGGSVSGGDGLGGLVGINRGTITNCYATGSVTGRRYLGGLVGYNLGTITSCYATGPVIGGIDSLDLGGLVGENYFGTISSCYFYLFSGPDNGWGAVLDDLQMQDAASFSGFNFPGYWTIVNGHCPKLTWQTDEGPLVSPPVTKLSGRGNSHDPFQVNSYDDFMEFRTNSDLLYGYYILTTDIDLSGETFTTAVINKYFGGHFDGNGHVISNITIDTAGEDTDYLGVFSIINASVSNLGIENINITGDDYLGGLCGKNRGTITNCYATGSVTGSIYLGGLCGGNFGSGTITNCYATGPVTGGIDSKYLGGLCGRNYGTITNCYAASSVEGIRIVGCLVGDNYFGTITNCYSTGSVTGGKCVGGLVGYNTNATITNCYSIGSALGDEYVGGLVGYDREGSYTRSFWDNTINPLLTGIGNATDPNVIGESTTNMQTILTFTDAGWDFVGENYNGNEDIWWIPQGDYPHLWWEGMLVPMKLTPRTLNCRSEGNWVKAHITLPEGFTVADIDHDRPAVLHSFGFQSAPLYVFVNKDKLVEIEAAFERKAVCSLAGNWPQALTVAGFLSDGNIFLGTSTVRIIHPGMKVIEELANCWLQEDCVYPETDINRDSLINLLDYALLMNINVEFVANE